MRSFRRQAALVAGVALFALTVPWAANADHDPDATDCDGTVTKGGVIYLDRRDSTGTWVYLETNGIANLQRGGGNAFWDPTGSADTDPCEDFNPATGQHYTPDQADTLVI